MLYRIEDSVVFVDNIFHELQDYENKMYQLQYIEMNFNDSNIVIKKPRHEGLTVNWANPKAYLLQGIVLAPVFVTVFLLKNFRMVLFFPIN